MHTGKVHGYNAMYDAPPLFPATTFNDADRSRVDSNWDVTAQAVYTPDLSETAEMIGWFGDGNFYIGNLDLDPESRIRSAERRTFTTNPEPWASL
jgi:iron complex outermembrane recepter protein